MKLIDKDKVVAELEKRRKSNSKNKLNLPAAFEDNYLLFFLDTLEMKEIKPAEQENEDEMVRKLCKELIESSFENELCNKEERDACINWLEKQEINKIENNNEEADLEKEKDRNELISLFKNKIISSKENSSDIEFYKRALLWLEKQGETSPVLSNSLNIGKLGIKGNEGWTEEDEKQLNDIIKLLPNLTNRHNWLKSLKQRLGGG